jgi:hypothetical protein
MRRMYGFAARLVELARIFRASWAVSCCRSDPLAMKRYRGPCQENSVRAMCAGSSLTAPASRACFPRGFPYGARLYAILPKGVNRARRQRSRSIPKESGWHVGHSAGGRYLQSSLSRALSFAMIVAAMLADRRRLFLRTVLLPNNLLPRKHLCLDDCLNFVNVPLLKIAGIYAPHPSTGTMAGRLSCRVNAHRGAMDLGHDATIHALRSGKGRSLALRRASPPGSSIMQTDVGTFPLSCHDFPS